MDRTFLGGGEVRLPRNVVLIALAISACGPSQGREVQAPLLEGPLEHWVLEGPAFDPIGVVEEPLSHVLDRPRDPRIGPSGAVHVVTGGSEIRSFSLDGDYLGSRGRAGQGPGEFEVIWAYRVLADGSWRAMSTHHLARLDPAWVELDRSPVPPGVDLNISPAITDDGSWVFVNALDIRSLLPVPGSTARTLRDSVNVIFVAADGDRQPIGRTLSLQWRALGSNWLGASLGTRPSVGAGRGLIAWSGGELYEVQVRTVAEGRSAILALLERPDAASEADLERWLEERNQALASRGRAPAAPPRGFEPDVPAALPAYDRVLIDSRSCVWARRFRRPGAEVHLWDILAPPGRYLAQLAVPASIRISEVRDDFVLGIETDGLGVGRIVGRRLSGPAQERACEWTDAE